MNSEILAQLVAEVIRTKKLQSLPPEKSREFHSEFGVEIADKVEQMRAAKRRAYEELRTIAVR